MSHAEAQRRREGRIGSFFLCAFAPLREISAGYKIFSPCKEMERLYYG